MSNNRFDSINIVSACISLLIGLGVSIWFMAPTFDWESVKILLIAIVLFGGIFCVLCFIVVWPMVGCFFNLLDRLSSKYKFDKQHPTPIDNTPIVTYPKRVIIDWKFVTLEDGKIKIAFSWQKKSYIIILDSPRCKSTYQIFLATNHPLLQYKKIIGRINSNTDCQIVDKSVFDDAIVKIEEYIKLHRQTFYDGCRIRTQLIEGRQQFLKWLAENQDPNYDILKTEERVVHSTNRTSILIENAYIFVINRNNKYYVIYENCSDNTASLVCCTTTECIKAARNTISAYMQSRNVNKREAIRRNNNIGGFFYRPVDHDIYIINWTNKLFKNRRYQYRHYFRK